MSEFSAFHRWLLKKRPYCEICAAPVPSMRIIQIDNRNRAVCDAHFASHYPLLAGYQRKIQIYYQSKTKKKIKPK